MRSIEPNIGAVQVVAPAVIAATTTSAGIDLLGFESACLVITSGAIAGDGNYTAKLQESDVSGSGYTDVDAEHLTGTNPASLAADSTVKIGYIGFKRYVRAVITKNSGTSIAAGAVLIKGHPHDAPVA